jgi:hypothetical protein
MCDLTHIRRLASPKRKHEPRGTSLTCTTLTGGSPILTFTGTKSGRRFQLLNIVDDEIYEQALP